MDKALQIQEESLSNPLFEQVAGKGRGRVFEFSIDDITLGREQENDIVLNDESVSRVHARIHREMSGSFSITDNQSRNGVYVNNVKVVSHTLKDGDLVRLGHFVFRFRIPTQAGAESGSSAPDFSQPAMSGELPLSASPQNKKRLILWSGVLVVLGGLWFLSSSSDQPKKEKAQDPKKAEEAFSPSPVPEFQEQGSSRPRDLDDPLTKSEQEISSLEKQGNAVKESEAYFKKGQREYFNKEYGHAIHNFDSALSLWNRHPLAAYYRGLALHDAEVEGQKNREMGLKYFNSLQYSRAIYHFNLAATYLSHASADNRSAQKVIAECERYIDLAKRKLKALELVP